nr:TonB-dependent siderophore receptor [Hydrococcus sp. Prado102]
RSDGNNFIVEIEGAQLQLPDGKPFRSQNPVAGISEIVITNLDDNTIQISAIGETALPQVELYDSDAGLIFGLTPVNANAQTPTPPQPEGNQQSQIIPVTGVQLNPTETGIELLLQTPTGGTEQLQPNNVSQGNNFIADIPNAQLQLPDSKPFRAEQPIEGISSVTVNNLDASTIRVSAIGETALPQVELFDSDSGLIFGLTPVNSSAQTPSQTQTQEIIPITNVQINPTETGIELFLQTPPGSAEQLQPNNVSQGNNFIVDIQGVQLQLPDSKPFRVEQPIEGIGSVTINNTNANTMRVTAVGETALPQVELFDSDSGLIFGFTPVESSAQTPTPSQPEEGQIVTIESVKLNPTETGFEILLLTPTGDAQQLRVVNVSAENNFLAQIPNAQLQKPFRQENPIEGVSEVTVTNRDENTVLVTVVGEDQQPTVELFDSEEGLIFSAISEESIAQEEDIELVVTGDRDGYRVPNASGGTGTDTPLRDIPQAIQVVPQQVLRDTRSRKITDALENVPAAVNISGTTGTREYYLLRGFETYSALINGLPGDPLNDASYINVDRIEVLRGPASALYGDLGAGGTINFVTRQPLSEPFSEVSATVGNYNFYEGIVDTSGPLNSSKTILYRLIAGLRSDGTIVDFNTGRTVTLAPSLSFRIGERTNLTVEGNIYFLKRNGGQPPGLPVSGTLLPNPNGEIPLSFSATGPGVEQFITTGRVEYRLEHEFSQQWKIRNAFRYSFYYDDDEDENDGVYLFQGSLAEDGRTLSRTGVRNNSFASTYLLDTNVIGNLRTGTVEHELLFGFSLLRRTDDNLFEFDIPAAPVDVFDPVYDQSIAPDAVGTIDDSFITRDTLGIYLQNRITLLPNLKFLLGGRFDFFDEQTTNRVDDTESSQSGDAFSPRVGIVYQPIPPISLYASYSRSFTPSIGVSATGETFEPERGTQYEVGIKADITSRLSATLALYDLTRTNVTTTDPDNPVFSVQSGEQRSRGVEFDVTGEILPGWEIIAGYAYTDARIVEDNDVPVDNRLFSVPEHAFNIWTTYRIQSGFAEGLGFGLGLYYLGDRPIDNANTVDLPSFLRTDAAIFYERGQFRAALNIRNLFDIENYTAGGSSEFVSVGTPFTIQGSLSWQF